MNGGFAAMTLSMAMALCAVGCSGKIGDYCDKVVPCNGGNDKDKDACNSEMDGEQNAAEDYDCGDQFDAWLDCMIDNGSCQGTGTSAYYSAVDSAGTDRCGTRRTELTTCIHNASSADN